MEIVIALGILVVVSLLLASAGAAFSWIGLKLKRQKPQTKLLVHAINDDRCTGCDACVSVCPTDVLELIDNKSRVERFDDCIQCEQCVMVCPTTALVMHYTGTQPPAYRMPMLDEYYQAAPGLYLIGEAAGKPLVKNASNLGRAVIEHLVRDGIRRVQPSNASVDVLIIGSGPGGLSAALSCIQHKLSYAIIEKDELIASTIARYPKGKEVMAEPYDVRCVGLLPVWDSTKDELIAAWKTLMQRQGVKVQTRETVEEVRRDGENFLVRTSKQLYRAQRVVMAIGTRGKPRRLGVPGELEPKVSTLLDDPAQHKTERTLVVGGGDSAVEAAIALAEAGSRVTLSYRGKTLSRCKGKNRSRLDEMVTAGRVQLRFGSNLVEIKDDAVTLKTGENVERVPNEHVFICIGGDAPVKWLESVGVRFADQPHLFQREATDRVCESLTGRLPETVWQSRDKGNVVDFPIRRAN